MGREESCLADWKESPVTRGRQERRIFQETKDDELSQAVLIDQGGKDMEYITWNLSTWKLPVTLAGIVSIEKAGVKLYGELEKIKLQ